MRHCGEARPFKNILKKMKKTLVRPDFFFNSLPPNLTKHQWRNQ